MDEAIQEFQRYCREKKSTFYITDEDIDHGGNVVSGKLSHQKDIVVLREVTRANSGLLANAVAELSPRVLRIYDCWRNSPGTLDHFLSVLRHNVKELVINHCAHAFALDQIMHGLLTLTVSGCCVGFFDPTMYPDLRELSLTNVGHLGGVLCDMSNLTSLSLSGVHYGGQVALPPSLKHISMKKCNVTALEFGFKSAYKRFVLETMEMTDCQFRTVVFMPIVTALVDLRGTIIDIVDCDMPADCFRGLLRIDNTTHMDTFLNAAKTAQGATIYITAEKELSLLDCRCDFEELTIFNVVTDTIQSCDYTNKARVVMPRHLLTLQALTFVGKIEVVSRPRASKATLHVRGMDYEALKKATQWALDCGMTIAPECGRDAFDVSMLTFGGPKQ